MARPRLQRACHGVERHPCLKHKRKAGHSAGRAGPVTEAIYVALSHVNIVQCASYIQRRLQKW